MESGWNHKEPLIAQISTDSADIFSFNYPRHPRPICAICG
jgi:hypothetical protein